MESFEPKFDAGPHPRAQIGFLAVANADLTERDMFKMKPEGVGVHFTRIKMPEHCTVESLASMEEELDSAIETLMPSRKDLDVICYNCTSGSFVIGENEIIERINCQRPDVQGTTLLTGVVKAFEALNVSKIAVGTAYTADINELEGMYFEENGLIPTALEGLSLMNDTEMNAVTLDSLIEFACHINSPEAEAVFLSCGALRSVEIIDEVEKRLGKPFVCSNQASMWHCLRLAEISDQFDGFGSLFSDC